MKTSARAKIIIGVAIVASILMLVGAYSVYAANIEAAQKNPPVVEKLITAFNLDRTKVDKVLGEYRQEREAQHKARLEERLDQQVEESKITTKQKEAILKKMGEMKVKLEELKNLSPEKRREALEKQQAELESWAKENGIDLKQFMFGLKGHMGGPRGYGRGPGGLMHGKRGFGPGYFGAPLGDQNQPTTDLETSTEL